MDFFQKKLSNTRSFTRQRRKSRIWIWIILIILLLCAWGFFLWKVFWAPANLDNWDTDQEMEFSLWEEVYLRWELRADWDIITHTHTINDSEHWIISIKSDTINLYDYAWFVELTGMVEKYYQWEPIVKVYDLSWSFADLEDEDTNIVLDGNSWV